MKKALIVALAIAIASLGLVACGGDDETTGGGAETQAETTPEPGGEAGAEGGAGEGGEGEGGEGEGGEGEGGEGEGGEAEGGTAGSASVLDFETPEGSDLAYTTEEASAKAGPVTVNFTNVQSIPHDVAIEDQGGKTIAKTEVISEDSASAKATLKPGDYTFYCTVPGHREAGMEGTLTAE